MKPILVVNSGSSSVKYRVIDLDSGESIRIGQIERVSDHSMAFSQMLEEISGLEIVAVGHRVVHGGSKFSKPTLVTDDVLDAIDQLSSLAPLHNPGNAAGIRAAKKAFPNLPQVAVFDTAFHQTMPASSYRYAIDAELERKYDIRRYGFHGSSHSFVSRTAADFLGIVESNFNAIVLHLGNGASACAIKGGKSFDTSMGLTPLQGLVMGTRSGDIDPAVITYLARMTDMTLDEIDDSLNKKSGFLGMTGVSDLRDVENRARAGDPVAIDALAVYIQRIRHYIGAYLAELPTVDALIFTAGVGENSSHVRSLVLENLTHFGFILDEDANTGTSKETRLISQAGAPVKILVVPTNEELEIAWQTAALL